MRGWILFPSSVGEELAPLARRPSFFHTFAFTSLHRHLAPLLRCGFKVLQVESFLRVGRSGDASAPSDAFQMERAQLNLHLVSFCVVPARHTKGKRCIQWQALSDVGLLSLSATLSIADLCLVGLSVFRAIVVLYFHFLF